MHNPLKPRNHHATLRKRYTPHKAQSGNIIVGVILIVVVVGILSLIFGKKTPEESSTNTQHAKPTVSIKDAKNNKISTQENNYTVTILTKRGSYDNVDISGSLNDTPVTPLKLPGQDSRADQTSYTSVLLLRPGDNTLKVTATGKNFYDKNEANTQTQVNIHLTATEKPTITIKNATQDGANWIVKDYLKDTFDLEVDTATENSKNSGAASLRVNDEVLKPTNYTKYKYDLKSLKDGVNTFTITAENEQGTLTTTLTINKLSSAEQQARAAIENVLSEAEVTCQQYAEKLFLVKDINIHYDQSSIRRQQPDGNLLIKVNIADSQGFWRQEKPLGIMECTTNPTGMVILNFEHY